MRKDFLLISDRLTILLVDLLFYVTLQLIFSLATNSQQSTSGWLELLVSRPVLLFALLLFFDILALLVVYHLSEQTQAERKLRFIVGATRKELAGYPLIDLVSMGILAVIGGSILTTVFWHRSFSVKALLTLWLCFALYLTQQGALWLILVRRRVQA
ncbi:hypothetical protein [Lapidilactobacillus luobeiensis]|uniref:hypothetical protein n=1 Tax=Lapidilactobacillus luobeiensis TaxID=2950371 RepID=UPI0021C4B92D|nr:hypothetical protein [Lapidilactobacillus luobeiensis]